jgi:hypothetical protein
METWRWWQRAGGRSRARLLALLAPLRTTRANAKRRATTRSFFDAVGPAQLLRYANLSLGTWLQWMQQERPSTHSMPRCRRPLCLCRVAAPRRNARHTAVERADMHRERHMTNRPLGLAALAELHSTAIPNVSH